MTALQPSLTAIHVVRPVRSTGPFPAFAVGEGVLFRVPAGPVSATILGVDKKARADMPLGLPYRLTVREAPPSCGYYPGGDYTIRAGCLERDPNAPPPAVSVPAPAAVASAVATAIATAGPMFLVAYLREGGQVPVQGVVLVRADTLEAASAAATQMLTAELEADVRERGESPEALVMLLNASEVPTTPLPPGQSVLASVSW